MTSRRLLGIGWGEAVGQSSHGSSVGDFIGCQTRPAMVLSQRLSSRISARFDRYNGYIINSLD